MFELIIQKFMAEMSDLQIATQVKYETLVNRRIFKIGVYSASDKPLFTLSWFATSKCVELLVFDGEEFEKVLFIGPVTWEQWLHLVKCLKIELDFETENLKFTGFKRVSPKTLEDKTNGWHFQRASYTDSNELALILSRLKRKGLRNTTIPYPIPFSNRKVYYHINFSRRTVEFWVLKR
jgi:hypothetical protein